MKVEVTETDKFMRSVAVAVPADDVESVRQQVMREIQSQAALPGFRKGKVPPSVIEKQFGETIRERTIERVLQPAAREVLEKSIPDPSYSPRVEELTWSPGSDLSFTMTLEVRPYVEVTGYKGLAMTREVFEVEEADVEDALTDLRRRVADIAPAYRRAQQGDVLIIDVAEVDAGAEPVQEQTRRLQVELTPELQSEPLGHALDGVMKGDVKRVVLDPATPNRELHVNVVDVCEIVLPPADEAFFQQSGLGESADIGRARIRQLLVESETSRSMRVIAGRIVDHLLAHTAIDLSPTQREVVRRSVEAEARIAQEEGRAPRNPQELEAAATMELKRDVLLDSIAAHENIDVTDAEVDAEIRRVADRNRVAATKLREAMEKENRLERVARDILHGKVLAFLVEQAAITVDTKRREGRSRIILPGGGTGSAPAPGKGLIVPGR